MERQLKNIYLLKDLARASGYSTHTLKYYLKLGLFEEIGRGPDTNFRYFDDSTVSVLRIIREMRMNRLSLREIKERLVKRPDIDSIENADSV